MANQGGSSVLRSANDISLGLNQTSRNVPVEDERRDSDETNVKVIDSHQQTVRIPVEDEYVPPGEYVQTGANNQEMKSLKRQFNAFQDADRAKINKIDELQKHMLDVVACNNRLLMNTADLQKASDSMMARIDALELENSHVRNDLMKASKEIEILKSVLTQRDKEMDNVKKEMEVSKKEMETIEDKGCSNDVEIHDVKREMKMMSKEMDDSKSELEQAKKGVEKSEKEIEHVTEELSTKDREVKFVRNEMNDVKKDMTESKKEIQHLKKELLTKNTEMMAVKNEMENVQKQHGLNARKLDGVKKDLTDVKHDLTEKEVHIKNMDTMVKEIHIAFKGKFQENQGPSKQIKENSKFKVYSPSIPKLETERVTRIGGYRGANPSSVFMDQEAGVYKTPTRGNYKFCGSMRQRGWGRLELYLRDNGTGRLKLLGKTTSNGNECNFDDVYMESGEGVTMWLEVVRMEGEAEMWGCNFCGELFD